MPIPFPAMPIPLRVSRDAHPVSQPRYHISNDNPIVLTVSSIHCYMCQSKKSWKDCDNQLTKVNCSMKDVRFQECLEQSETKIVNGTSVPGTTTYHRRCAMKDQCVNIKKNCGNSGWHCESRCCTKDFCNNSGVCVLNYYLVAVIAGIAFWKNFITDNHFY